MSERILRALMQLFAIIAVVDENENDEDSKVKSSKGRIIIEAFLKTELSNEMIQRYLDLFDEFLSMHHGGTNKRDGAKKRTSVNSVKVLRICSQINEELTQRQKMIVLLRVFGFIYANNNVTEQESEFVQTVAESFNISPEEYSSLKSFIELEESELLDEKGFLYVSGHELDLKKAKQIVSKGFIGTGRFIRMESVNTIFFRYSGEDQLNLNGLNVKEKTSQIFNQGSIIKTSKSGSVYYSDVISRFLESKDREKISLTVENVVYRFKNGNIGLHPINIAENEGTLIGVMGGSGAGKSTFLNVMNGNLSPSEGSIKINGIDLHKEKSKLEGVIGFVSQDDLLIEELSVFQNLFFNAKLCFNKLSEIEIKKKCIELLSDIGLSDASHLRVGSPLDKTISGGQRKRLNIALELIREPSILFLDEPTSGLSSRDSENIMDMLKELTLKGKLVFTVIHQPSSDIFKMFDKLFLLDQGGYPIFNGNPTDAVVYFKTHVHHVKANERECPVCGNVNPEMIFNVIEQKVVDEYGNQTKYRKVSAKEWNERYLEAIPAAEFSTVSTPITGTSHIANKLKQFNVFFKRDVLSKLANKQYMLINMLEAPLLAAILAFFVKFFNEETDGKGAYSFFGNENIPQYLFISVVVSLFLGLTVAAEEIIKDKKILKRESFLNLSRGSYLWSKIGIMFIISAIQSALYVLVGNLILEIDGMWFAYWFVLFTTSCAANVLGLNISSAFNSAKVIYITVPLLIIPQLLFSGVIVKFDKLHPLLSSSNEVPWVGNVMFSRWSYEALAVTQAADNCHESPLFDLNQQKSNAAWKRDYWVPEMKNQLNVLADKKAKQKDFEKAKRILTNEIEKEKLKWANLECKDCKDLLSKLKYKQANEAVQMNVANFIDIIKTQSNKTYNESSNAIDKYIEKTGNKKFQVSTNLYLNESLQDLVTNRTEVNKILITDDELIQKDDPLYINTIGTRFLDAPFYSYEKHLFGTKVSTYWSNMAIIWIMTVFLILLLYYDILRKILEFKLFKGNKES